MQPVFSPVLHLQQNYYAQTIVKATGLGGTLNAAGDITIELLLRGDYLGYDYRFADLCYSESFNLHKYEGGGVNWMFTNGGGTTNETGGGMGFAVGDWSHLVATIAASNQAVVLYRNGVQVSATNLPGGTRPTTTINTIGIGQDNTSNVGNNGFSGYFAIARVYQRVLALADVQYNLANLMSAQRANLYLEWLMPAQNPLSLIIYDSSGNNHNATITKNAVDDVYLTGVPSF